MGTVVLCHDFLDELVVDVVPSVSGVHLVTGSRDGAVHSTKVGGTCSDVNDERVRNHVKGVSDGKRLRDDHGGVHRACGGVKDRCFVDVTCLGRSTDDGHDTIVVLGIRKADEVRDEVSDEFAVFRCVLDDTEFKRAVKIESESVLQGLVAKQHVSLEEVSSDGVLRGSDDGQLFHFMTVRGYHHRAERPQVDSNIQHIFRHRLTDLRKPPHLMNGAHMNHSSDLRLRKASFL